MTSDVAVEIDPAIVAMLAVERQRWAARFEERFCQQERASWARWRW